MIRQLDDSRKVSAGLVSVVNVCVWEAVLYQRVISVKVLEKGVENWNENEADNRNVFILMVLNLVTILN